jgi:crotonobetainyl-CoA:carnitine CoA-transferase CaiB-like acyl-CoA transferase
VSRKGPLAGIRVLELGSLVAGPYATSLMALLGATVIKVEPPGEGDPLRNWRHRLDGTSLWWLMQSRNKLCVTIDLKREAGQRIARRLVVASNLLVENFKPGMLESWGLGWEELHAANPKLVMARVSGFGQSGPYRGKPGFGSIAEALGGLRHLTGYPDQPPVRTGISIGDSIAALYATIGALAALREVEVGGGEGQVVDVALTEAVFSLLESTLPEFDIFGVIRERTGAKLPGIAVSSTYRCADGAYLVIAGNGDSIFKRLMQGIGRPDLAEDPRFRTNADRVKYDDEIDAVLGDWAAKLAIQEALAVLDASKVPASKIYDIADIAADPQFLDRGMVREFPLGERTVKVPGIVPRLSANPGEIEWLGPALGEHNREVFGDLLGMPDEELRELEAEGVI